MDRICCFFNHPSHYRESIYSLMDEKLHCDFFFGDEVPSIKEMDCSVLKNVTRVHYGYISKKILYIKGVIKPLVKKYDTIVVTPATNSITHWLLLLLYKLLPNKRIYFWTHGLYGNESKRQLFFKKLMYKNATGVFLYGNYAKKIMIDNGFDESKLYVVYNSLNYEEHLALRKIMGQSNIYIDYFGNDNPTIILIGRLNRRKKIELLIEAVEQLNRKNFLVNVVIVGDGTSKEELFRLTCEKNINNQFWFYGACYDEKTNAELIFNSDLCIVPGDIGLTALHAMTFGVPVISHDYFPSQGPEFEIITPGVTGVFFKNGDAISLSEVIYKWLNSSTYNRDTIRQQCYSIVDEKWNPQAQIKIFEKILLAH